MQAAKFKAESQGRKAKLASSYHELLEEFSSKDLRFVGNYALGRLIGKGSFGKVYLATHKLTNGSKVVLKSANKDDSNLAREIHHHRQFMHPHITRLYEVIVTENLVWMVLEYCPGDELYNYLLKNGALPASKVQKIFTQLVGAVSYVHNMSCVHRDLKLENILFDKNENVKLCDFGFTREYEGKASYLQTFCGTVCYSAPEMLKGEKYAGEKVDVWSLGVILYALLCGELPFDDDDDSVTRTKILTGEPKWPDHIPPDAKHLLTLLLSKRPLRRPALSEILAHPFLAEHAPNQQAILKLQQAAPFTTPLEKDTLDRMRSAGVDIDQVIENVLAQRCDSLAGWWALLLEKEIRKQARRERKRKEKEAEIRASRRLSTASSRLERLVPPPQEVDEESDTSWQGGGDTGRPTTRGRKERRSAHYLDFVQTDLPGLPENAQLNSTTPLTPTTTTTTPPPPPPAPIDKDALLRSASSSRHRPVVPPKEEGGDGNMRRARSRGSTLQLVSSNPDLLSANGMVPRKGRRRQHALISQLSHWKHWLLATTKRGKAPNEAASRSAPNLHHNTQKAANGSRVSPKGGGAVGEERHNGSPRNTIFNPTASSSRPNNNNHHHYQATGGGGNGNGKQASSSSSTSAAYHASAAAPRIFTTPTGNSSNNNKRNSLSPAPLTPHSSFRRSSGLRGRKSTSSSVSSIRSMHQSQQQQHHHHHQHSHSKASSTSSNGSGSASIGGGGGSVGGGGKQQSGGGGSSSFVARSPHHSVKVLPATPTTGAFPSNIRVVRQSAGGMGAGPPLMSAFNESMSWGAGSARAGHSSPSPSSSSLDAADAAPCSIFSASASAFASAPALPGPATTAVTTTTGGLVFAKRKKNIFKGPMLSVAFPGSGMMGGGGGESRGRHGRSSSTGGGARRKQSGEMMREEIREEDEDEVEEVEAFSPVVGPGEQVVEEDEEETEKNNEALPPLDLQTHTQTQNLP